MHRKFTATELVLVACSNASLRLTGSITTMATRNFIGGAAVPLSSAHSLAALLLLLYLPLAPRLAAALPMDDQRSAETQKIQRKSDAAFQVGVNFGGLVGWFRVLPARLRRVKAGFSHATSTTVVMPVAVTSAASLEPGSWPHCR